MLVLLNRKFKTQKGEWKCFLSLIYTLFLNRKKPLWLDNKNLPQCEISSVSSKREERLTFSKWTSLRWICGKTEKTNHSSSFLHCCWLACCYRCIFVKHCFQLFGTNHSCCKCDTFEELVGLISLVFLS